MTVTIASLHELGINDTGVDKYYINVARSDNKQVHYLESLQTQIDILKNLGKGFEDELVFSTLDEASDMRAIFNELIQGFKAGDVKALEKFLLADMKESYPTMYNEVLVKRNEAWIPIIQNMLKNDSKSFVLVGALHLIGEDGLIALLRHQGYVVQQLDIKR